MSVVFGPYVTSDDVEEAVTATLQLWLPTYLAEMCRHSARTVGAIPAPRTWSTVPVFMQYVDDQIPAAIVTSGGTVDEPYDRGDGTVCLTWGISVFVLVRAPDVASARELASLYATAVALIVSQKGALKSPLNPDGFSAETRFVGYSHTGIPVEYSNDGAAIGVALTVRVDGALSRPPAAFPPGTPELSPPDPSEFETALVTVERNT